MMCSYTNVLLKEIFQTLRLIFTKCDLNFDIELDHTVFSNNDYQLLAESEMNIVD